MPRAASQPAAERRARAIQALLELACHRAPEQISTAAVAERMGISHAALFRHFPSREALWAESVRWATGQLEEELRAIAERESCDPLQRVRGLLQALAAFFTGYPGLLRMLLAELPRPGSHPASEEAKSFAARLRVTLIALLEQADREGRLRSPLPPANLAPLLLAACEGMMLQGLIHDTLAELPLRLEGALLVLLPEA